VTKEWKAAVQPICDRDWARQFPGMPPVRTHVLTNTAPTMQRCCLCGALTMSGIRFPVDPETVPFPTVWR
jgi:hypothetical protein